MSKTPVSSLLRYAESTVGGGYVWGAEGEKCSPAVRSEMASRTGVSESNRANIMGACAKWDGRKIWDCSGLFRGETKSRGKRRNGGATSIWREWVGCGARGTIDSIPMTTAGVAVFTGTESEMRHIGLYMGDGTVIDARGSSCGVLRSPITSHGWTHWAMLADEYCYDSDSNCSNSNCNIEQGVWSGKVKTKTGSGINLWNNVCKLISLDKIPEGTRVTVLTNEEEGVLLAFYKNQTGFVDSSYLIDRECVAKTSDGFPKDGVNETQTTADKDNG